MQVARRMDGMALADQLLEALSVRVERFSLVSGEAPRLGVVLFGDDGPSLRYVEKKQEAAARVGVTVQVYRQDACSEDEAREQIRRAQQEDGLHGCIVQLPLPKTMRSFTQSVLDVIDPARDVDCLTSTCRAQLAEGDPLFVPPTPAAVFALLDAYDVSLEGAHVVLVGHGTLVGKPLSALLPSRGAVVTICDVTTKDVAAATRRADVVISGTGVAGLITGEMLSPGVVVIDAGTTTSTGTLTGDVDEASVLPVASLLSPVPGGVGPLTVVKLLENVVRAAERVSGR